MYQALIRYIYIAIRNAHSDAFHMAIEAIFYLQTSTYARTAYTKVSFSIPPPFFNIIFENEYDKSHDNKSPNWNSNHCCFYDSY